MKKYIQTLGYSFTENDVLTNRQFRHLNTSLEKDEELSTLGNIRNLITSEWELSLKYYDASLFSTQIKSLYDDNPKLDYRAMHPVRSESNDEVYYLEDYSIESEKQENGTLLTITFIIRGD